MNFARLMAMLLLGCIAFALVREMRKASPRPAGLRGHIRARGWGVLLLPAAVMAAAMSGRVHALAMIELAVAGALVAWAPRLAAKVAPYAVLALGVEGLVLAKAYHDGFSNSVLYGLVPAGGFESWRDHLVLPEAGLFFILGVWLLLRVQAPGSRQLRALIARWLDPGRGGISPAQGLLLIPVTAMALLLLGPRYWFSMPSFDVSVILLLDAAVAAASLVLVFRSRVWAATVGEAGLLVLGAYGLVIAAFWPAVPGFVYGFSPLTSPSAGTLGTALQGTALLALGLWLAPRVMREHMAPPADPELAARAQQLTRRSQAEPVARLTPREREVLALMAEGRSNAAIAAKLFITEKAVSKHAAGIFARLDLAPSDDDNRRVLAVLAYLDA